MRLTVQWEDRVDGETPAWTRVGTEVATVKGRTLAHADQPMPGTSADRSASLRSVIEHLDLELGGPVLESDVRSLRLGSVCECWSGPLG